MSPPKAVVFDLGKVLLDFDYSILVHRMAPRSRLNEAELNQLLNQAPLLLRYETGALSTPEFFDEVQSASGFNGSIEEFTAFFADIFTPIEPMIALHAQLRSRGVPTYIFSNTNEIAIAHIRRVFPFFADFTGYVLSYEHNVMKPDAALYSIVEQATGLRETDLLYLDDRPENITAGAARGWRAILHQEPAATEAAVRATGLLG
ncbi:MAG: HAD family phosphatase [Pedosphaera sp.]|nr:HAD family phosphatase [Pedosphaera sp.]